MSAPAPAVAGHRTGAVAGHRTGAVVVRPARPEELAAVGALTVTANVADGLAEPGGDYARKLGDAAGRARHGTVLVAVECPQTASGAPGRAPEADRIVGTVTMLDPGAAAAEVAREGEVELRMLAVDPGARGRGVALELVLA
ncbi:MAG: GNAT family N-acetyltransferase, partial [Cellulomonadaceae bacterium]